MSTLRISVAAVLALSASLACAQGAAPTIEQRLQQLEAEQAAIKQQLAERDAVIQELKRELQAQGAAAQATGAGRAGSRGPGCTGSRCGDRAPRCGRCCAAR